MPRHCDDLLTTQWHARKHRAALFRIQIARKAETRARRITGLVRMLEQYDMLYSPRGARWEAGVPTLESQPSCR